MSPQRDRAPAGCMVEARGITKAPYAANVPYPAPDAQAGKWLAMALYNCGVVDMDATEAAFARHPEWVAA